MKKLLLIAILTMSSISYAFEDYDVDFEPTKDPAISIVRIIVDDCVTTFKVKTKELKSFSQNGSAISEMIDISLKRASNGCK